MTKEFQLKEAVKAALNDYVNGEIDRQLMLRGIHPERVPIFPGADYIFRVEGAEKVTVSQGRRDGGNVLKFDAVARSGVFILPSSATAELRPNEATSFLCSATGKPNWAFNIKTLDAIPDEF